MAYPNFSWRKKINTENIFLKFFPHSFSLMWGVAWPFAWLVRKTMMRKDRVGKFFCFNAVLFLGK
jgi:hypothetical protein